MGADGDILPDDIIGMVYTLTDPVKGLIDVPHHRQQTLRRNMLHASGVTSQLNKAVHQLCAVIANLLNGPLTGIDDERVGRDDIPAQGTLVDERLYQGLELSDLIGDIIIGVLDVQHRHTTVIDDIDDIEALGVLVELHVQGVVIDIGLTGILVQQLIGLLHAATGHQDTADALMVIDQGFDGQEVKAILRPYHHRHEHQQQQDDLAELLTHTHLPEIIDTAKTVSDRLVFLQVLEQMVYNDSVGKPIKERTQFHRLLLKELWIFGEKYTLGTSDQSLKNLLKEHIAKMGRSELVPDIPPEAVQDLTRIPDICLFEQICPGYEKLEHLVIELKRPTLTLTMKEVDQIRDYAITVAKNPLFDKDRTKWHFILLGQDYDENVRNVLENQVVGDGNFYNAGNISISIMKWSRIIQDNKLKYEYLRTKLNHQLSEDPNFASDYLRTKHAELFPAEKEGE